MTTRGPHKAGRLLNLAAHLAAGPRTAADRAPQLNVSHRTLQRRLDPSDPWSPIDPARDAATPPVDARVDIVGDCGSAPARERRSGASVTAS